MQHKHSPIRSTRIVILTADLNSEETTLSVLHYPIRHSVYLRALNGKTHLCKGNEAVKCDGVFLHAQYFAVDQQAQRFILYAVAKSSSENLQAWGQRIENGSIKELKANVQFCQGTDVLERLSKDRGSKARVATQSEMSRACNKIRPH